MSQLPPAKRRRTDGPISGVAAVSTFKSVFSTVSSKEPQRTPKPKLPLSSVIEPVSAKKQAFSDFKPAFGNRPETPKPSKPPPKSLAPRESKPTPSKPPSRRVLAPPSLPETPTRVQQTANPPLPPQAAASSSKPYAPIGSETPLKKLSTPRAFIIPPSSSQLTTPKGKSRAEILNDVESPQPPRRVLPIPTPVFTTPSLSSPSKEPRPPDGKKLKEMSIPSGFTIPESKDSDDGPFSSALLAGMSPDKNGRKKFIKNGLAEKAAHLMSRADTSFSLWRKEKEKEISRSSKPQSRASAAATDSSVTPSLPPALESRTTAHTLVTRTADIKLLIEEIIFLQEVPMAQYLRRKEGDDPPPPLRLGPGVRAVHARCKILSWTRPKEKYEFEFGEPKKAKANDDIEHKPGETMDIWFRLSHGSEPGPRPVSSWDGLEAGKEVYVWRPIHELTKENMLICTRFLCIK